MFQTGSERIADHPGGALATDFDYHALRERDYPLLAAPALAERLRHVAALFHPMQDTNCKSSTRRKG